LKRASARSGLDMRRSEDDRYNRFSSRIVGNRSIRAVKSPDSPGIAGPPLARPAGGIIYD
jgi:hypothetical protein